MIKLVKSMKPQVLVANEVAWTTALVAKLQAGLEPTKTERSRYRHPDIKQALIVETAGKCAYCESKLLHTAYGDIEHIHPKSKDPSKTFDWQNLTLACDVCNTNKGDVEGLIDPYTVDPKNHFYVYGPLILANIGDDAALVTQRTLALNRGELVEKRQRRIEYLQSLCFILAKTTDPNLRAVLRQDYMTNETTQEQEFTAVSLWFFEDASANGRI